MKPGVQSKDQKSGYFMLILESAGIASRPPHLLLQYR